MGKCRLCKLNQVWSLSEIGKSVILLDLHIVKSRRTSTGPLDVWLTVFLGGKNCLCRTRKPHNNSPGQCSSVTFRHIQRQQSSQSTQHLRTSCHTKSMISFISRRANLWRGGMDCVFDRIQNVSKPHQIFEIHHGNPLDPKESNRNSDESCVLPWAKHALRNLESQT